MEYYLATKGNEVLTHATTKMNIESMLSERSQSQKDTLFQDSLCTQYLE